VEEHVDVGSRLELLPVHRPKIDRVREPIGAELDPILIDGKHRTLGRHPGLDPIVI
jgi:hypothetical protein